MFTTSDTFTYTVSRNFTKFRKILIYNVEVS